MQGENISGGIPYFSIMNFAPHKQKIYKIANCAYNGMPYIFINSGSLVDQRQSQAFQPLEIVEMPINRTEPIRGNFAVIVDKKGDIADYFPDRVIALRRQSFPRRSLICQKDSTLLKRFNISLDNFLGRVVIAGIPHQYIESGKILP
jgi:hypothetical protein